MSQASNLVQAQEWCEQARGFLGVALLGTDSNSMKTRVKEIKKKLAELDLVVKAKKNQDLTNEYGRLEEQFLALAGEAHDIAEKRGVPKAEKVELIKTVSGNLNILGARIRVTLAKEKKDAKGQKKVEGELEKLIDPQQQREFEDKGRELMALVETMRPIATTDNFTQTKSACQLAIDEHRNAEQWVVGKQDIISKVAALQLRITELQRTSNSWVEKKKEIPGIRSALEPVPPGGALGHSKQTILDQLRQAEDYGNLQKNFTPATELIVDCQKKLVELNQAFTVVKQKVEDFKTKEAGHRKLLSDVLGKRNRLLAVLKKTSHQGVKLPITPELDPEALASIDKPHRHFEQLVNERHHALTTFEGWEGYPGQINVARAALEKEDKALDVAYFDNRSPQEQEVAMQGMAVKAIKDDMIATRKRTLQTLFNNAMGLATTAMGKMESALGPVHADVKEFAKKIKTASTEFDTDPGHPPIEALKKLAGEMNAKILEFTEQKRLLLERRNTLAREWNEGYSVWRSFRIPSTYLEALSKEFDLLAQTYVETLDNLDTMREGITKLERVVARLKEVMKDSGKVRQSRTLFGEIQKLLKDKTLPVNQSLKLAELTGRCEELDSSGAIDTEDPGTLHPKLTTLKNDVTTAITTAATVARLRTEITELFNTLAPLFLKVKTKIASNFIWLPENYVISFEADAKLILQKANVLEIPLKLEGQKSDLAAIKVKLEEFDSLPREKLSDHLTRVERPNLDLQLEKSEHLEKLTEEWNKLHLDFTTKTLPACVKAVDQNVFSRTFGEDKMKDVKTKKKEAEKLAEEGKYADAISTLKIGSALANSLINMPSGSKIADSLKGLDATWKSAAENLKSDLTAMISAVESACEETKSGSSGKVVAALRKGKLEFDAILDKVDPVLPMLRSLAGETATNPRDFAEKVLQVVRQQQSLLDNPLMKNFAGNPFSVAVRVVPLSQKLRTLDYHLRSIV